MDITEDTMIGRNVLNSGGFVGAYSDGTLWSGRKSERNERETSGTLETVWRLVVMAPQPWTHLFWYHGKFVNNAKYRKQILRKYRRKRAIPKCKKLTRKDSSLVCVKDIA